MRVVVYSTLFLLLSVNSLFGQTIDYSSAFDSISADYSFHYIGDFGRNKYVLKTYVNGSPDLLIFDSSGEKIKSVQIPLPQLSGDVKLVALIKSGAWSIIYQQKKEDRLKIESLGFDTSGKLIYPPQIIDSITLTSPYSTVYDVSVSKDRKQAVLYRLMHDVKSGKVIMDYLIIEEDGMLKNKAIRQISYNRTTEEPGEIFYRGDGEIFFTITRRFNQADSSSKIHIYQLKSVEKNNLLATISYKGIQPMQPVWVKNVAEKQLAFASLYIDLNARAIKGLLITTISADLGPDFIKTDFFSIGKAKASSNLKIIGQAPVFFKTKRGDQLSLADCFLSGEKQQLFLLFENKHPAIKTENIFSKAPIALGQQAGVNSRGQYTTSSQEFDELRRYLTADMNSPSRDPGNGSVFVFNQGIAPVSTRDIINSGGFSEVLLDRYSFGNQSFANSDKGSIKREFTLIGLNKSKRFFFKSKLSGEIDYGKMPAVTGVISDTNGVILLSYYPDNAETLLIQQINRRGEIKQSLMPLQKGIKLIWSNSSVTVSSRELSTFYIANGGKQIGLAKLSL
jgi:hypothetical protein